jgi:hypothetical protein
VIIKFIQMMMACVIFNPFCCCTAGMLTVAESGKPTPAHSCCPAQSSSSVDGSGTAPASNEHNPDDCPHQALKDFQSTALKDVAALHDTLNTPPQLYSTVDTVVFETVALSFSKLDFSTASHAPPRPLSQVYCVYRI